MWLGERAAKAHLVMVGLQVSWEGLGKWRREEQQQWQQKQAAGPGRFTAAACCRLNTASASLALSRHMGDTWVASSAAPVTSACSIIVLCWPCCRRCSLLQEVEMGTSSVVWDMGLKLAAKDKLEAGTGVRQA